VQWVSVSIDEMGSPLPSTWADSCSGPAFLRGKLWPIIREQRGGEVLAEVVATVKALSLRRPGPKRAAVDEWLEEKYRGYLAELKPRFERAERRAERRSVVVSPEPSAPVWKVRPARGSRAPRVVAISECNICSRIRDIERDVPDSRLRAFQKVHQRNARDTYVKCPRCGTYYRHIWESEDGDNSPSNWRGFGLYRLALSQALRALPAECQVERDEIERRLSAERPARASRRRRKAGR
jgi:hypothetical protein